MLRIPTFFVLSTVLPSLGFGQPEAVDEFDEIKWLREALVSSDFSAKEKELMRFQLRLGENGYLKELKKFQIDDGVDQFEAWFLARVYITTKVSLCGVRYSPKLDQDDWIVPIAIGQDDNEDPPVRINRVSGVLTGDGYPMLADPMGFVQTEYKERLRWSKLTKEARMEELRAEADLREAAIKEEIRQNWLRRQRQSN